MQLDDEILDKVDKITHHSGFLRNQNGFIVGFHKQFFLVYRSSVPCWSPLMFFMKIRKMSHVGSSCLEIV